jgi:hypothetical protein
MGQSMSADAGGLDWSDRGREDREARHLQDAAASVQRAAKALEAAAAESGSSGRRGVYASWARHLLDDWRGVALLAARVDPDAA